MTERIKLGVKEWALVFSAVNLTLFLMYFIPYYVIENGEFSLAYEYFRIYVDEILRWLLPVAAATLLILQDAGRGIKKVLINGLLISLSNLVYTLPFYYLLGIERGGDTPGSLAMSLLVSVGYVAVFFLHVLTLYFIIKRSAIFFTARELAKELPVKYASSPTNKMRRECMEKAQDKLPWELGEGKFLNLSHPTSLALFFASLFEFTVYIFIEIFNAASYLISYAGSYKSGEIGYMIFRFVFILAMLFLSLAVSQIVKRHTKSDAASATEND